MEEYIRPLIGRFEAVRNPKRAELSRLYVKEKFEFFGLDAKTLRSIIAGFLKEFGYPPDESLGELALHLWKMKEREYHQTAIEIVRRQTKKLRKEDISWIEQLIVNNSWWDTVDGIAVFICGDYFRLFPDQIPSVTGRWIGSDNIWLIRSAILFQLKYKSDTDTQLLAGYIGKQAQHKDFFVRKAIGWILREYSKINPGWVREFVQKQTLSGLSYREATKYV